MLQACSGRTLVLQGSTGCDVPSQYQVRVALSLYKTIFYRYLQARCCLATSHLVGTVVSAFSLGVAMSAAGA